MRLKKLIQSFLVGTFIIFTSLSEVSLANTNQAPDCTNAVPSKSVLWPANHKFDAISINGISDPDGGAVSTVIQCIKQDEPLNSTGDGNSEYDGSGIGSSTALVRKERKGNSNGRVYHISYIATDNEGAQCEGTVQVSVPHNKKKTAIDEGPIYDSVTNNGSNCGSGNLNNSPSASDQSVSIDEDSSSPITLSGSDPDGDTLIFSIVNGPANGVITGDAPNLIYTPRANYTGSDSFTFISSDGQQDSEIATVSIVVSPVNDRPIAEVQTLQVDEDTSLIFELSGSDIDGDELSYVVVSNPSKGKLIGTSPNLTYIPNPNFNGNDSFMFVTTDGLLDSEEVEISINVSAVDDSPIASSQQLIVNEDKSLVINLFGNDIENNLLTYSIVAQPASGALSGEAPNLTYTPYENFNGSDNFTFIVNDGNSNSNAGNVTIFVNSVNDLPTVEAGSDQTVVEGSSIQLNATANDSDGQIVNQRWEEAGQSLGNGFSLVLNDLSVGEHVLTVTVTDNEGGNSSDSLKVTVEKKPNVAPEALSDNKTTNEDVSLNIILKGTDDNGDVLTYSITTNPANGTLLGVAPNITYRPNANFAGEDTFSFTVNDGTITSISATVNITINPINDAPTINAGEDRTVLLSTPVSLNAEAKDTEGEIVSYEWKKDDTVISDSKGLVLNDLGLGVHQFTVKVTDADGLSSVDSVKITVEEDQTVLGSLVGKVVDETGVMIVNAKVKLPSGESTVSDFQGNYIISDLKPIERTTVTAMRSGFLQNSDIIKIVSGMQTEQNIIMSRPKQLTEYEPTEGSMIETDGLTVEIPAGAEFTTESGTPFEGDVMINTSYFPITTEEGVDQFPGDTIAVNEDNEMGNLTSYGYIKLEANDQSGNPLELAEGMEIEVSIPADDSLDKPATIPFWYFDEEKAMWVADGEATYDPATNTYKTTVDQVATFNLDSYAGNVIGSLDVCIEDDQGNKIPGYVTLAPDGSNAWRNTSKTSDDGLLRLNGIIGQSNFNLYASSNDGRLGEYSNNPIYLTGGENDLGTCIILDNNNRAETLQLSGTIVDESGNAKPNIEIKLFGETGGQSWGKPSLVQILSSTSDANGNFLINIDDTTSAAAEVALLGNKKIVVKAIDGDTKASKDLVLEKGQNTYVIGNISLASNMPPFANAGVDITEYLGNRVSLIAERSYDSDGSIVSYEWRENDQIIGTSSNISTSALGLGEHIIVLTVTDNFGLKASDEIVINIIDKRIALFADAGRDQVTYLNGEVLLKGTGSISLGSSIQYEWSEGETVLSTSSEFRYKLVDTLLHTIKLKVTNLDGLEDTDEVMVSAFEPFGFLNAGLDKSIFEGEHVVLYPQGKYSFGFNPDLKWMEGDTILFAGDLKTVSGGFVYRPTELGIHTLKLEITNEQGVQKIDTVNIIVVEKTSNSSFANAGLDKSIYLNETVALNGAAESATNPVKELEWSELGNVLGNTLTLDYSGLTPGIHNINFKVTFDDDSVAEDQVKVTVYENSNPTTFIAYAGRDRNIVFGAGGGQGEAFFGAEGYPLNKVASYEWSINGEILSNSRFFTYNPTSEIVDGTFTLGKRVIDLKLTSTDGVVATDQVEVQVRSRQPDRSSSGWVEFESVGTPYSVPPNSLSSVTVERGGTAFYPENIKLPLTEIWTVNDYTTVRQIDFPEAFQNFSTLDYDFSQPDFYFVRYSLQDAEGNFFTATPNYYITVHDENQENLERGVFDDYVFVDAGLDESIYLGENVVLDRGKSYSMISPKYEWKKDGQLLFTGENFTYTPTTLGEHRIQLTVTETFAGLNISETDEKIITVLNRQTALVIADAGLDKSFYDGLTGYIDGAGTAENGISKYQWSEGNDVLSNSFRFNTESLAVGKHTLTLMITDGQGNTGTDEVEVTIVERERGIEAYAGPDSEISIDENAFMSSQGSYSISRLLTFEWKIGDEIISTSGAFSHKFDEAGVYTIVLTVTDADGLTDSDEIIITVVESERSIFADAGLDKTMYQGTSVRLTKGESYSLLNPTMLNYEWSEGDTVLSQTIQNADFTYDNQELGEHILKLTVTDTAGLVDSDEVVITVKDSGLVDIVNPVITMNGEDNITINVGDIYEDQGATAVDDRDGVITGSIISRNNLLTTFNPGNFTVTYKVKDNAGNEANATRKITVLSPTEPDTIAPVMTLIGSNPVSIPQGRGYSDAGVTVLDNRDGKIGYAFNSTVNIEVPGSYQYVYTATDRAGNTSEVTRTINVIADPNRDTIKPVITLVGETIASIPEGGVYTDEGATALDNIDGDITSKIIVDNTVNTDVVGQYFVNYSVNDTAGNESILTRTVLVTKVDTPDTLPPILVQSLEWLESQTQADGSYTNSARISLPIQSTADVLRAYHRVGEELALGIPPAVSYLNDHESSKVEFLSRKIIAAAEVGNDSSALVTELLGLQNIDRGYGDQGHYHSSVTDTAFTLKALGIAGYNDSIILGKIIAYLKTQQSVSGGFSHSSKNQDSVYETALALIALQNYQDVFDLQSVINSGNQYLMNNQIAGGGWDSHWETAYALIAMNPTSDTFTAYQVAAGSLKAAQLSNGSWDNDVYTTALAIRALYKSENLDTP